MYGLRAQALASWARSLAPGGVCVVVMWPSCVERQGPWAMFDQVGFAGLADLTGRAGVVCVCMHACVQACQSACVHAKHV